MPTRACFPVCLLLLLPTLAAQDAGSSFGHARARELAELGRLPTARDIVVRDVVNYHRHRLPLPRADAAVALDVRCDDHHPLPGHEVWVQIGYTTAPLGDRRRAQPCAVALVVDVSGSMAEAGKLTAVQAGLRAFVEGLRPDDDVALIAFSTEARVVASCRERGDGGWLLEAIDRLAPSGSTNLHAGLLAGLDELAHVRGGRGRRVVLLTDGIANVGITRPDDIVADAARRAEGTIDVATIGVGQNLDVALLQRLADGARGLFHFVADATDVQKVFVQEAEALLAPVARRPRLVVELPRDLVPLQVFDERARMHGDRVEADLPDLNAGVTAVVLVRCRVETGAARATTLPIRAELVFDDAERQRSGRAVATAELAVGGRDDGNERGRTPDVEVLKNAAIALLAHGLEAMARACDARRWADAQQVLLVAVADAERLRADRDDADLRRVREIVDGHLRTLARHVDRFRDY